jgi:PAS domain S-box-containing protein
MDKKRTVLVVDDVPDDIAVLEEILKRDYQVKAVTKGEDALAIARGPDPPDLILLDIIMPDMDGFEVCRALKQESGGAEIPVIFLTAKAMQEDEVAGLELGAVDYIRKPVDPEVVRTRVRSQLELKDKVLRLSEMKYRRLFETARDGIIVVDVATGAILDANPALAHLMGSSQEAFLGKKVDDLEFLRTIVSRRKGAPESAQGKYVRYPDLPLETLDGRKIDIEFISKNYQVDRREIMQITIREITDLVAAELERDRFAARLAHYLSTSPTITYSLAIREGAATWEWISENVRETLGYSSEEALAPDWWFDRVNALDRARVVGIVTELSKNGTASREYRFSRKDGSVVWLHDEMRLFSGGEGGPEIVGTLTDVTGRKKAEEEIHLKSSALDAAANAVVITDRVGRIEWANPAFSALTGYSVAEAAGMVPGNLVQSGRQDKEFYRRMWDTILSGKVWSGRIVNKRKSGELYDEEMTITPVLDESFNVSHFIAVKNDVTESELARKRLEGALREKEDLLREIHHRVNNNMQVIISLFNVSAQDIGDPALRLKQADFVQRIQAMALIHGQFYDSKDISRIDFAAYLRQLANKLGTAYPDSARRLEVDCGADEVFLHLEQAIPAGLIVEELLINALKHAFPSPRDDGRIGISQRLTGDGKLAVEVRDNGVGVGDGVDLARANTLGMLLVRALATQVGATISFENEGGTVATMRLPLPSGEGGKLTT